MNDLSGWAWWSLLAPNPVGFIAHLAARHSHVIKEEHQAALFFTLYL